MRFMQRKLLDDISPDEIFHFLEDHDKESGQIYAGDSGMPS